MCAWNVSVLDKEIMMRKVTFEIKRKMIQVAAFAYSNLCWQFSGWEIV